MLYLFTALYCEAHGLIREFHLKKNMDNTRFQEFYHETEDIRLIITGVGEIAAAAAVSSVCTRYKPGERDMLLNIGTCARKGSGGIFVCNKLMEQASGKTFYPDILYRHEFEEETLVTGMRPWNGEEDDGEILGGSFGGRLYDMEAAAIYQAGAYFFGPHQMVFLKVVSDAGEAEQVSSQQTASIMEAYQEPLLAFIKRLSGISYGGTKRESSLWQERNARIERLSMDMHCSKVMKDLLEQHIHYLELSGAEYSSVIQDMYREGLLPCKDKREGKLRFEELKRRLL